MLARAACCFSYVALSLWQPRCHECRSCTSDDEQSTVSVGSLLAEILSRQQAKLPSSEQQGLDRATLDAMTREASGELANTWEKLSTDLSSVERNVSQVLRQQLDEAESTTIARLTRTESSMRRNLIAPNRRDIQHSLLALRNKQVARAKWRGDFGRPPRLRDEWWKAKLQGSTSGVVHAAEWSACGAGALLVIAALDMIARETSGGADMRAPLVTLWRAAFGVAVIVYVGAITSIFLAVEPSRDEPERR